MLLKSMLLLYVIVFIDIIIKCRFIGKGEVESSILSCSTIYPLHFKQLVFFGRSVLHWCNACTGTGMRDAVTPCRRRAGMGRAGKGWPMQRLCGSALATRLNRRARQGPVLAFGSRRRPFGQRRSILRASLSPAHCSPATITIRTMTTASITSVSKR